MPAEKKSAVNKVKKKNKNKNQEQTWKKYLPGVTDRGLTSY